MAQKQSNLVLMLLLLVTLVVSTWGDSDGDILIKFKSSLSNGDTALANWRGLDPTPCSGNTPNWSGLRCLNGQVYGLRLENLSLSGVIDMGLLVQLPALRTLSFMNNSFDGPMPDVKRLGALRLFYLSYNKFTGEIPENAFDNMKFLRKVHLARNQFTGKIPASLAISEKLVELNVEGNRFDDKLPDLSKATELKLVNFSNNQLVGPIPPSLGRFDMSAFAGNEGLCGKPLKACKSSSSKKKKILIIVGAVIAIAAAIIAFTYLRLRGRRSEFKIAQDIKAYDVRVKEAQTAAAAYDLSGKGENSKLHFVRDERQRFDLQDLLRASAEVLGSGSFGSTYKAFLLSGPSPSPALVVKRFRHMSNVGKEDFHDHMRRLGPLSHPNVLPLVAFYYRKEEKLLVSDFVPNGSLAIHLHGKRGPAGQPGLDWPTRLKIIKGVAKGLAYLYQEFPSLAIPHGHLKSSNVVLNQNFEPLLTDYALVPVVNKDHAQEQMVAYKSPDFTQQDRTTRKTDVWSLGILILEMLTGKFPANYLMKQGKGANADLASWVSSVVREEWTGEVFDKDMKGTRNGEGEMLKLLKIGMCCCEWNAERRWDLREAVDKIEELKERDNDNFDDYSYASEDFGYSSKAVTDDDFSFSVNG